MDHLTATGDVVLVSLGGKPEMPEVRRTREMKGAEDEEKRGEEVEQLAREEKRKQVEEKEGEAPWSRFHRRTSSAASPARGSSGERPEGVMRLRRERTNQSRRSGMSGGDGVFEEEEEDSGRTRTQ